VSVVGWPGWSVVLLLALLVLPLVFRGAIVLAGDNPHWSMARWDSAGLAPNPATTDDAVIQFYAARTWGWRGIFGVHSWVAFKPKGAPSYSRYEVVGWGVRPGVPAIRLSPRPPDGYWAGNRPELLADCRGPEAERLIERLEAAIRSYPFPEEYRLWPGPNSNTFTAYLARALPELGVELPPTAIGKDYLPLGDFLAASPSGTGIQLSVAGLLGLTLGWRDGIEANLFGLVIGLDLARPALKLPGLGRLGIGS
jgi:hypothetical protein